MECVFEKDTNQRTWNPGHGRTWDWLTGHVTPTRPRVRAAICWGVGSPSCAVTASVTSVGCPSGWTSVTSFPNSKVLFCRLSSSAPVALMPTTLDWGRVLLCDALRLAAPGTSAIKPTEEGEGWGGSGGRQRSTIPDLHVGMCARRSRNMLLGCCEFDSPAVAPLETLRKRAGADEPRNMVMYVLQELQGFMHKSC